MTEQEETDFAPIFDLFPLSEIEDGTPIIRFHVTDDDGNPFPASIDMEGALTIDTSKWSTLRLTPERIALLGQLSEMGKQLYDAWVASPTGKARKAARAA